VVPCAFHQISLSGQTRNFVMSFAWPQVASKNVAWSSTLPPPTDVSSFHPSLRNKAFINPGVEWATDLDLTEVLVLGVEEIAGLTRHDGRRYLEDR